MKCDFDYCIYNKKFICILDKIQMNSLGMCDACIIVSYPKETLEELKKNQLQKIMDRYDNSDK